MLKRTNTEQFCFKMLSQRHLLVITYTERFIYYRKRVLHLGKQSLTVAYADAVQLCGNIR